jgi:predicted CXXCH cytochrome family protein
VAVALGGLAFVILTERGPSTLFNRDHRSIPPRFVGSQTCADCHRAEANLWRASQHEHAMGHATPQSVLGDFNDTTFNYNGVDSRFFRKDTKYFVETDGPDGKLAEFEIKYTFGIDPLQQYLIEFPDGRIQALSIAWDTRPKAAGGQRWFHLYPDERIDHNDVLHWTKLNQNWNFMCAECHSTGVQKSYDAAHDRFATTWTEISVGCEACHGQGSNHVEWARQQKSWWPFGERAAPSKGLLVRLDERSQVIWRHDPKTGNPQRNWSPALLRKEVETCGRCHARRAEFSEDWIPGHWLSDTHLVSSLSPELYFPDGQMRDREETYNYGPFKQSRMFAAGVTCSDCHDPHSAGLRLSGDNVCLQCHSEDKYAASSHNHHAAVNPQLACASCHMPARTYMVIDRRHDHSFRVPRPDLSKTLGTPNACNDCHADRSSEWAAAAVQRWFGSERIGFQKYAEAFHDVWADQTDAQEQLAAVAKDADSPGFVRASALTELAPFVSAANFNLARAALNDADPMVRIGALDMLARLPPLQVWPLVSPLLSDSSRGVRIKAVDLLAAVPTASQPPADRGPFDNAAFEFIAAQRLNADRPEARSALGSFFARRGQTKEAETEYQAALRLSPQFAPAAVNLADLYRQLHRDEEGEAVLRAAIAASPADAGLHYALGLTLTRLKQSDGALAEFHRATELQPEQSRYTYVLAVALHSAGHVDEAISVLKQNVARHPNDSDTVLALMSFNRDAGNFVDALRYAEQLAAMRPGDRDLANLILELRRQAK